MLRLSTIGMLVTALGLGGGLATPAVSAEWHTNGHKTSSTTNAGEPRLALHDGATTAVFGCVGTSAAATFKGPTLAGSVVPGAATVTLQFISPCLTSSPGYVIVCLPAELNAFSYTGGTTFATAGGGVTSGTLTNINCSVRHFNTPCMTITGSVNTHYINPNPIASGAGTLVVTVAGQSLIRQPLNFLCAIQGAALTLGKPTAGVGVANLAYTFDGPSAPYLFRTP